MSYEAQKAYSPSPVQELQVLRVATFATLNTSGTAGRWRGSTVSDQPPKIRNNETPQHLRISKNLKCWGLKSHYVVGACPDYDSITARLRLDYERNRVVIVTETESSRSRGIVESCSRYATRLRLDYMSTATRVIDCDLTTTRRSNV